MQEIDKNPAYDEVPHVLSGLSIPNGKVSEAGVALCKFIDEASALIAACSANINPDGILADAVRKFDIRMPLELLPDLDKVPGMEQLIQGYQAHLGALRIFEDEKSQS